MDAIRDANATLHRLLVVGGRRHLDKGNPAEVDAELWTTQLDRLVAYEPAEMIAVVEAGMRVGELERILAEGGQEWPSDAPERRDRRRRDRERRVEPATAEVRRAPRHASWRPRSSPATGGWCAAGLGP